MGDVALRRIRCTNCGADFSDISPGQTVFVCRRAGCGASFLLSQGEAFASVEVQRAEVIINHRQALRRALENRDSDSIGKYASVILGMIPKDFRANLAMCLKIMKQGIGDPRPLRKFLDSVNEGTASEFLEMLPFALDYAGYFELGKLETAAGRYLSEDALMLAREQIERQRHLLEQKNEDYADVPRDVFICHSSQNIEEAEAAYCALREDGWRVWMSTHNLDPDCQYYWESIERAIRQCRVILVVCTKQAMQSYDVQREMRMAREAHRIRMEFKVDDAPHTTFFKDFFDGITWIDARGSMDSALDRLKLLVMKAIYPEPEPPMHEPETAKPEPVPPKPDPVPPKPEPVPPKPEPVPPKPEPVPPKPGPVPPKPEPVPPKPEPVPPKPEPIPPKPEPVPPKPEPVPPKPEPVPPKPEPVPPKPEPALPKPEPVPLKPEIPSIINVDLFANDMKTIRREPQYDTNRDGCSVYMNGYVYYSASDFIHRMRSDGSENTIFAWCPTATLYAAGNYLFCSYLRIWPHVGILNVNNSPSGRCKPRDLQLMKNTGRCIRYQNGNMLYLARHGLRTIHLDSKTDGEMCRGDNIYLCYVTNAGVYCVVRENDIRGYTRQVVYFLKNVDTCGNTIRPICKDLFLNADCVASANDRLYLNYSDRSLDVRELGSNDHIAKPLFKRPFNTPGTLNKLIATDNRLYVVTDNNTMFSIHEYSLPNGYPLHSFNMPEYTGGITVIGDFFYYRVNEGAVMRGSLNDGKRERLR